MKHKAIIWLVTVALFVNQTYAYAFVPCESIQAFVGLGDKPADADDSHEMSHPIAHRMSHDMAEHQMPHQNDQRNDQQRTQQKHDCDNSCCDQECSCPVGTFSSALLMEFHTLHASTANAESISLYPFLLAELFLPSLRKPPIIG
jgi:hypothetical protein